MPRVLLTGLLLVGTLMCCLSVPTTPLIPLAEEIVPTGIHIPSIGVNSQQLMPLGLAQDRTLQVPPVSTPQVAGWYTGASVPGDPGTSIIVSHVDGDGQKGLFFNLSKVRVGDQVSVDRSDGSTAVFTITKVGLYCKEKAACPRGEKVFPSAAFYSNQQEPQLHLETCGGRFDAKNRNYLDAFVVFSTLSGELN